MFENNINIINKSERLTNALDATLYRTIASIVSDETLSDEEKTDKLFDLYKDICETNKKLMNKLTNLATKVPTNTIVINSGKPSFNFTM